MESKMKEFPVAPNHHQSGITEYEVSTSQDFTNTERKRSTSFPAFTPLHRQDSFVEAVTRSTQSPLKAFVMEGVADPIFFIHESASDSNNSDSRAVVTRNRKAHRRVRKMYVAAMASLFFALAVGMASGYSSPATFDMQQRSSSRIKPDDDETTWIGSIIALGALVGGLIAGPLADKFGRKGLLMYNSLPFMIGWLLIIYAHKIPVLLVGRFITGISCGTIAVAIPMYTVEISTPEVRGLLGSSFQGILVIGTLSVMSTGAYLVWTWLAVVSTFGIIFGLICLYPMPESPRWLVAKGRKEEALEAIKYLQSEEFDSQAEVNAISEDLLRQPKGKLAFRELLHPAVYKPSILSCLLVFFQQFSGSNAIMFYAAGIFKSAGSTVDPSLSSVIIAFIQAVATLFSNVIIDRSGRKILLFLSGLIMSLCMAMLGIFYFVSERNESFRQSAGWMPLVCLMFYMGAFALGYGPIPLLMTAEMLPVRARSVMIGFVACLTGVFVFIVTKMFKSMEYSLKSYGTFWFYSGISLLGCVIMGIFLPETKGKRLEDMQKVFMGEKMVDTKAQSTSVLALKEEF